MAKRADSPYEAGDRSGAWRKFKLFPSAAFLIGGYHAGRDGLDALLVGTEDGAQLRYVGKVPTYLRREVRQQIRRLLDQVAAVDCPFQFVPEQSEGDTWSVGITKSERDRCRWLKPVLRAEIEFVDRTRAGMLRQCRFRRFSKSDPS